jgi:hypothetical protein
MIDKIEEANWPISNKEMEIMAVSLDGQMMVPILQIK